MKVTRYILLLSLLAFAFASVPTTRVSGGEDKFCPVHHVPLKKEKLEIIYASSLIPATFDRDGSSEKYFPYANSVVYGACISTPDSPKNQEVLYCPNCRDVEKTWPCIETHDTAIITTLSPPRVSRLSIRP
jgi:hypothetical protein